MLPRTVSTAVAAVWHGPLRCRPGSLLAGEREVGRADRRARSPTTRGGSMRTRSGLVALLGVTVIAAAACSSGAPAVSPGAPGSKIGLVTDVGTLDDKHFNQYSW